MSCNSNSSLFTVPPLDVEPAYVLACIREILGNMQEMQNGGGGGSASLPEAPSDASSATTLPPTSSAATVSYVDNNDSDTAVTAVSIGAVSSMLTRINKSKAQTCAEILGSLRGGGGGDTHANNNSHQQSSQNSDEHQRVRTYEFLIPYTWRVLTKDLSDLAGAGRLASTGGAYDAYLANTTAYWHSAYAAITNDLLPFLVRGARVLVLGNSRLLRTVIGAALDFADGAEFYILEGRPDMPHEEYAAASAAASAAAVAGGAGGFFPASALGGGGASSAGGRPLCCGERLADRIRRDRKRGSAPGRLFVVPDSAAASLLPKCNFVLMGANAATMNGGLCHRAGSLQLATLAKAMNVPTYVVCESFKFFPICPIGSESIAQPSAATAPAAHTAAYGPRAAAIAAAAAPPSPSLLGLRTADATSSSSEATAAAQRRAADNRQGYRAFHHHVCADPKPAVVSAEGPTVASASCHVDALHSRSVLLGASSAATAAAGGVLGATAVGSAAAAPSVVTDYIDFVPGDLITFFFTDKRVLTPAGVMTEINNAFPRNSTADKKAVSGGPSAASQ